MMPVEHTEAPATGSARNGARSLGRARLALAACILAAGALLAAPASASAASTWVEGTAKDTASHPFHVTRFGVLLGGPTTNQSLVLPYELLSNNVPNGARPTSIQALSGGSILVADPFSQLVYTVPSTGGPTQIYNMALNVDHQSTPVSATRTSANTTLIVDNHLPKVIEIDSSQRTIWTYGDGNKGTGDNQLEDPWWAVRLANGHTLIADGIGGYRVIEVDTSGTVTWQYGQTGTAGAGADQLKFPTSAEREGSGNTLICDRDGNRVIEVNPAKEIVWHYGTGTAGAASGQLAAPTFATRLASGNTLITDSDNKRVIEVNGSGSIVQSYGTGTGLPTGGALAEPRMAQRLSDGSTLVADADILSGTGKVIKYAYSTSGYATSDHLDMGSATTLKRFLSISWKGTVPTGGAIEVWYSIAGATLKLGGTQKPGTSGASFKLPTAAGTYVSYKVVLKRGTSYATTPVLNDLSIAWQVSSSTASPIVLPPATQPTVPDISALTTGLLNPSFTSTSSVDASGNPIVTPVGPTDSVVQRGAVLVPAGGLNVDPNRVVRVGSGASTTSQVAGVAVIVLVLTMGFALSPLTKVVPKIHHAATMLLK